MPCSPPLALLTFLLISTKLKVQLSSAATISQSIDLMPRLPTILIINQMIIQPFLKQNSSNHSHSNGSVTRNWDSVFMPDDTSTYRLKVPGIEPSTS